MMKLLIYCISLIVSSFAISGIHFDNFIKKNHVKEARVLSLLMILALTYLIANFCLDIIDINLI